jgi:hypothetical protein
MTVHFLTALLVMTFVAGVHGQRDVNEQHLAAIDQWVQKSYQATDAYRSGDRTKALELLGSLSKSEQERAVNAIRAQVESIAAGHRPKKENVVQWTPRLLRTLGALHMEAAIAVRATRGDDAGEIADHHLDVAQMAFAAAAVLSAEPDTFTSRWILAIGLERLAEADFGEAFNVLIPYCGEKQTSAPLLVACGSLHETVASLPAAQLAVLRERRLPADLFALDASRVRNLNRAKAERRTQLDLARKYFERAVRLDSMNVEALLRLAQVRMQQKDILPAAELLEKLIGLPLQGREKYLSRLFLARVRDIQKRGDDASALLDQAAVHQSSLLARAHHAQRRGDARTAAALVERASLLGTDDPWWGYRFGQYWIPPALFKELREEARK